MELSKLNSSSRPNSIKAKEKKTLGVSILQVKEKHWHPLGSWRLVLLAGTHVSMPL